MTTATATAFRLPDLDTVHHCEGHGTMTLGQMLDGVDPDLIPSDQTMYEDLLWAFGAWESLEEMNAAMATRVYATGPTAGRTSGWPSSRRRHNRIRYHLGAACGSPLLRCGRLPLALPPTVRTGHACVSSSRFEQNVH